MNKLVSVIIPVYNVEKYLDRCIRSVVDQTYPNLQILLTDDGSTDHSYEIMERWAKQDPRIELLHKPNGGLSDARNFAMKHARGQYWAFIDSDDFIKPSMIEHLVQSAEENHAQIAVCDMEYLYDNGQVMPASGGDFTIGEVRTHPELIRINNSACNKLFAAELFQDIEFPVGKWYEDLATIPMLCMQASRIVKVDEPGYVYYQRSGSIAHSASPKIFHIYDAIERVIGYINRHCTDEGMKQRFVEEMRHCYIIHGLDLTTLRIKDFDRSEDRARYLEENMKRLNACYPQWNQDSLLKSWGMKKKLIVWLLKHRQWKGVLRIYDRSRTNN